MTRSRLEEILFDNFENKGREYIIESLVQAVNETLDEVYHLVRYSCDEECTSYKLEIQDKIEDLKVKTKQQ